MDYACGLVPTGNTTFFYLIEIFQPIHIRKRELTHIRDGCSDNTDYVKVPIFPDFVDTFPSFLSIFPNSM